MYDELKDVKSLAIGAVKDFMSYHEEYPDEYKGFNEDLIRAIRRARTETEVRHLMQAARKV